MVVASYNGERTLKACLDSLERLNYPDYEVILVDDGSTDATRQIAFAHPNVRYFRHEKNLGLSVARNTGIAAATGEIIAFTDSDCRADEDWLYYLVGDLLESEFAGIGGPNLLPPGGLAGGRGGHGFAGRPGARDADRPPGRAHSRLQHGVLQVGAGAGRRVRSDLPQGGGRRGPVLALAAGGLEDRFQPGGLCLALPALDHPRLFETAARLRRGGSLAGAQAPGMLQFVWRQPLARAHLRHLQIPRPDSAADHLPGPLRQRRLPVPLRLRSRRST